MAKVLITGATGNVGLEVLKALSGIKHELQIIAGVRDQQTGATQLPGHNIQIARFDFENVNSFGSALQGCDILFLLRPPQISDVKTYFKPLIRECKAAGVKHIVFLSVQGVEKSRIIPHHKIEKLIVESQIAHTFLRPAYFMQNFTTTLRDDIVKKRRVYLPAGDAKFTLIDVADIGRVAAAILANSTAHINKAYDLTNDEKLNFREMTDILSRQLERTIHFESPNPFAFYCSKRKERVPRMLILVMIMLHYLPRFQKEPETTRWVETISGRRARSFAEFITQNKSLLV
ncbi:NmrA family NAD(P)-binding protein [Turneriella parva]|uniref:NmrA family protein n=1 Tax=Turneriella parva (strain ATCC BAA-1111 / DSM 21527 / NCTC 11395 / H) TaxID=869212 RepID=I4B2I2_TURPD|nr:NmrA family NAD(P)-binding protein [Turneriella parva]AFM11489.1 NmrA family protein [Turneriella parva DSM 21527]